MSASVRTVSLRRMRHGAGAAGADDRVAVEEPLEIRVNGAPFAVVMRTPGQDLPLAAGFLLAEDVIREKDEIAAIERCDETDAAARGNTVNVTVTADAAERVAARLADRRHVVMTAACGLCGRRTIESLRTRIARVDGAWTIAAEVVYGLPDTLRNAQTAFDATGGLHAAALCDLDGRVWLVAEDIGRHNAVDKIVGRALLEGRLPLDRSLLVVSGRASFELIQKALLGGVPLVAGVSAPSSLAVDLAAETGITLCGFVRGHSMNVYTHPGRISDAG